MPKDSQLPPGATSKDIQVPTQATVKPKGPMARAKAVVGRWLLSDVNTSGWFTPQQPINPQAPPDVKGRAFDYQSGYNLNFQPRSTEPIGFAQLRFLADNCDILRLVIETRKDQMASLSWNVKPKDKKQQMKNQAPGDQKKDPRAAMLETFFQKPDGVNTWKQWLRAILEDLFVIDGVSIYKRKTVGGKPFAYELLDGSTVFPLLNDDGRRPIAPDPAFQQILKGVPAADFTAQELMYLPRNVRTNRVYGFPPVQQVLVTVNTAILRAMHQLDYYTEGSIPDAIIGTPTDWQPEQITAFQKQWDEMIAGNLEARRRAKFVPGDFKFQELKQPALKDEYDEWLARVICFAFSIPPTAFIKAVNRASAESSHDQALEEGLLPIQLWVKEFMDDIIQNDFGFKDLEFGWEDDREVDPETQCSILVDYVKAGVKTINEVRDVLGDAPVPGPADELMVETATGFVPLDSYQDQQDMQQQQMDNSHDLATSQQGLDHKVNMTAAKNPAPVVGAPPAGAAGSGQKPGAAGQKPAANPPQRKQASPSRVKDKKAQRLAQQAATKVYLDILLEKGVDGRKPITFQPADGTQGAQRLHPGRETYPSRDRY